LNDSLLLTFASHPLTESAAIISSLIYIFLASKGNIWCWLAGFSCTFFYTFIFIYLKIDSQVILNVIYMILSVVGWMIWLKPIAAKQTSIYVHWPVTEHLQFFVGSIVVAICLRYALPSWFDERYTFIESWLFCASLMATILTIYRVIESWLYWVVIDLISLGIYWQSQEDTILLLYFTSLILAIYGYSNWNKYRKQDVQQASEKDNKAITT
jgi:nicotinamide mononucleotide transporter